MQNMHPWQVNTLSYHYGKQSVISNIQSCTTKQYTNKEEYQTIASKYHTNIKIVIMISIKTITTTIIMIIMILIIINETIKIKITIMKIIIKYMKQ